MNWLTSLSGNIKDLTLGKYKYLMLIIKILTSNLFENTYCLCGRIDFQCG